MKLSIIVPCYDEEETMPHLSEVLENILKELRKKYEIELIFVDDGSTDNTLKLLKKFFSKYKFAKIAQHKTNRGIGAAFRTGIKNSTGDIIFQFDADCTYPAKDILNIISYLRDYDIVTASPYHPNGKVEGVQKYRLLLSKSASSIYKILSGSDIHTYTSSFRAYKADAIKNIKFKSDGFVCFAEVMILALMKNYKVKEYPSVLSKRKFGQSKMKTLKVIFEHMGLMGRILWIKLKHAFG